MTGRNRAPMCRCISVEAAVLAKIATLYPLGLAVTGKGDHYDFVSRYFAPGTGIPADPVTGSTHATLVPYWAKKLGKLSLSAFQCANRGGHLGCELRGDRVFSPAVPLPS